MLKNVRLDSVHSGGAKVKCLDNLGLVPYRSPGSLLQVRRLKGVPIYEYECGKCHHRFEIIQRFSDRPLKKCDKCGGPVHKVLSAPALVFKGAGWYATDYANPDRKKAMKAERDGDGGNGDKKTEKTDTADSKPSATASKKED